MGEHNCHMKKKNVEECIKRKAYELWEKDGRKTGSDLHYWLNAEKSVNARKKKQPGRSCIKIKEESR